MKIEKLEVGMVVKSYRELCDILEIKQKGGNSKKAQIKEVERYITYRKEGNKFIIRKINEHPNPKQDARKEGNNSQVFKNCQIPRKHWDSIGVYSIVLYNDIYIGSTYAGFRERFIGHRSHKYNPLSTLSMIQKGAVFSILEICENITEPELRTKENKWIEYFLKNPSWNVKNTREAHSYTTPQKERGLE